MRIFFFLFTRKFDTRLQNFYYVLPSGQNCQKKNSLKECVFVNLALKIQYHIVKYTLLQTDFSAILPTGYIPYFLELINPLYCQAPFRKVCFLPASFPMRFLTIDHNCKV